MLLLLALVAILSCASIVTFSVTNEKDDHDDPAELQMFRKIPFDTQTAIAGFLDQQSSSTAMETDKNMRNLIYHEITHNVDNKYQFGQVSNVPSVHQFAIDPTKQHYRNIVDFREIWQIKRVMYFEKLGLHIQYNNSMNHINDINDIQLAIDLASVQNWLRHPGGSDFVKLQTLPFSDPHFDVESRANFDICQFDFKPSRIKTANPPICQRTKIQTVTDMKLFSTGDRTSTMDFLALTSINLHDSQLSGTATEPFLFPSEFTHLKHLDLSRNILLEILIDFGILPNTLETLIVDEGQYSRMHYRIQRFEITPNIFSNLPALKVFHVPSIKLQGSDKLLSEYTFNASQLPPALQEFVIPGNNVQGHIGHEALADLPRSLRIFNVMGNRLSGTIKLDQISPLLQLEFLDVRNNNDLEIRMTNDKSINPNLEILYDTKQVKYDD